MFGFGEREAKQKSKLKFDEKKKNDSRTHKQTRERKR